LADPSHPASATAGSRSVIGLELQRDRDSSVIRGPQPGGLPIKRLVADEEGLSD
jgi:hypothetical protein